MHRLRWFAVALCLTTSYVQAEQMRDQDQDHVDDEVDRCPASPGPKENMGCPDRDEDADGIVDRLDQCPTMAGPVEARGCPVVKAIPPHVPPSGSSHVAPQKSPEPTTGVELRGYRIVFPTPLPFAPRSAQLLPQAQPQLAEAAQILKANVTLGRLSIEGHVDEPKMSARAALALSVERARTIQRMLVTLGLPAQRLIARGFGYGRLLDRSESAEAQRVNNRVEIIAIAD